MSHESLHDAVSAQMLIDAVIAFRLISASLVDVFILLTVEALSYSAFFNKDFAIFVLVALDDIIADQTIDHFDASYFNDESRVYFLLSNDLC